MEAPVPLTLVTGFLGSGKTTLLNRILASEEHRERVAVIVNEFGDAGIDGKLVVGAEEHLVELTNGCICCTVREDLRYTLADLLARRRRRIRRTRFDRVLIEASGLAAPGPALQTVLVDDELAEGYVVDGVVALACAPEVSRQLTEHPEVGDQIAYADLVLLNHADRATEEVLLAAQRDLAACNARARVERTVRAEVALSALFGLSNADAPAAVVAGPSAHSSGIGTVVLRSSADLDPEALKVWLAFLAQRRGMQLMRIKGRLAVRGQSTPWVVHGIHQWLETGPGVGERPAESLLVLIGRDLDRDEIRRGWEAVGGASS